VDLEGSVFVGDAAGRKGDFSCSDRDLATNVGILFKTPEEFFLNEDPEPFTREFDPSSYLTTVNAQPLDSSKSQFQRISESLLTCFIAPILFSKSSDLNIVLFCGSPGAGKSTFYWKHLKPLGYERINQDILKSVSPKLPSLSVTTY